MAADYTRGSPGHGSIHTFNPAPLKLLTRRLMRTQLLLRSDLIFWGGFGGREGALVALVDAQYETIQPVPLSPAEPLSYLNPAQF